MMYPLVRELAAPGAPIRVPVAVTCRVLNLARQPYYRWLAQPVTAAELEQAYRADALFDAHLDDPEFGYRYLVDEARDAGHAMSDRTAWRICSSNGWWSAFGKPQRGKGKRPGPPVHDDLCAVVDKHGVTRHRFVASTVNELWLSDITEHWTGEGKLYLCAIKDVYSNRIVGYSIDSRMKSRIAVNALTVRSLDAATSPAASCTRTEARSSAAASWSTHCTAMTWSARWVASAPPATTPRADDMESFFALLQKNVLNRQVWTTRQELRIATVTCRRMIERTYHRRRRQASLGRLTPIEYETIMTRPATQAA